MHDRRCRNLWCELCLNSHESSGKSLRAQKNLANRKENKHFRFFSNIYKWVSRGPWVGFGDVASKELRIANLSVRTPSLHLLPCFSRDSGMMVPRVHFIFFSVPRKLVSADLWLTALLCLPWGKCPGLTQGPENSRRDRARSTQHSTLFGVLSWLMMPKCWARGDENACSSCPSISPCPGLVSLHLGLPSYLCRRLLIPALSLHPFIWSSPLNAILCLENFSDARQIHVMVDRRTRLHGLNLFPGCEMQWVHI
jgi:hypothetical protein